MTILFLIVVIELIRWQTRCSTCGRWLALQLASRVLDRERYVEYLKAAPGTPLKNKKPPLNIYTYEYSSVYVCRHCGETHVTDPCTLFFPLLRTGTFPTERVPDVPGFYRKRDAIISEAAPPPTFSLASWRTLSRWRQLVLFYGTLFLIGFSLYNPRFFQQPGNWYRYVCRFGDFLNRPFSKYGYYADRRVNVAGSSWDQEYTLEEFEGPGWKALPPLTVSGSGPIVLSPDVPGAFAGEARPGQRRIRTVSRRYSIRLVETRTGEAFDCPGSLEIQSDSGDYSQVVFFDDQSFEVLLGLPGDLDAETTRSGQVTLYVPDAAFEKLSQLERQRR